MLRRYADEGAAGEVEVSRRRGGTANVRKRCALSSAGASDPLRKLRLKRAVVRVCRRGALGGGVSPCSSRKMSESSWNRRHCHGDGARSSSVSARKLVSALWQLNKGGLLEEDDEEEGIARDAAVRRGSAAHRRCMSVEFSGRSRRKSKFLEADGERSWHDGHGQWFSERVSNGSAAMEVHSCASSTCSGERMAHLQDMYNSLIASRELVKALANIWGPADLTPSTASLLSALRAELDAARAHARRLIKEQARRGGEADQLRQRLAEEARAWRSRQREKAAAAVQAAASELDGERRSRRRAEKVASKLGKALAEREASLRAAEREAERERRSRERLEKVCGELVRGGAGAGAGEVEEMRREAERAQEELEKEREMLQLADELREERVQMKLMEARLQFEEKSAVVEQLRSELEAFLDTKKDRQGSPPAPDDHSLQLAIHASQGANVDHVGVSKSAGEDDDDYDDGNGGGEFGARDSDGSDMHSIELNLEASRHGSFSVSDRGTERAGDPWSAGVSAGAASYRRSLEVGDDELEEGDRWDDDGARSERTRDLDEDAERYQAIKNLREQMLAGHGRFVFLSSQEIGLPS